LEDEPVVFLREGEPLGYLPEPARTARLVAIGHGTSD
jgi:hypothetical protein